MEPNELKFITTVLKQRKRDLKLQIYYEECDIVEYEKGLMSNYDIDEHREIVKKMKIEINNIDKIIKKYFNNI